MLTSFNYCCAQNNAENTGYIEYISSQGTPQETISQLWFNNTESMYKDKDITSVREWAAYKYKKYNNKQDSLADEEKIRELDETLPDKRISKTVFYKNVKNNYFIKTDFDDYGKKYCVYDTLKRGPAKWQLTDDTTTIAGFKCQKANLIDTSANGKLLPGWYVWYAVALPVPFGPKKSGNLPGVILEMGTNDSTYKIKAFHVEIPYKGDEVIAPCQGGKIIGEAAFDNLLNDQNEQTIKFIQEQKKTDKNN